MNKLKYVNVLIVSCLLALAVFNNKVGQNIIVGLIAVWVLANLIPLLLKQFKKLTVRQKIAETESPIAAEQAAKDIQPEQLDVYEKTILQHFNCRITDKLKASYPDIKWQWYINNPVQFAMQGGIGRINVFNAGEFSFAEVKLDQFGRMDFNMIKVAALEEKKAEPPAPAEPVSKPEVKKVDVAAWFEGVGGDILSALITEFNTQGHTRMFVEESGDVFLSLDGKKTTPAKKKIPDFPGKNYWDDLIKVLKVEELKAAQKDNQLIIAWS